MKANNLKINSGVLHRAAYFGMGLLLMMAGALHAGVIYVPNASFESPSTAALGGVYPVIGSWQDQPQSPYYNPADFSGNPWYTLMGVFENTTNGSFDHLNNINGDQAAYIFTFPGAGFFQDYVSTNGLTGVADHAFNATFEVGRSYQLTGAFTSSSDEPLTNGASMEMALYYRDAGGNMVIVASNNIVFATNVFTNLENFVDFTVNVPTVYPTNAWAGKNIGIEFISTTTDFALVTGVWDVDNVRLASSIVVPNYSFESPSTAALGGVYPLIASWQDQPQSPYYDPADFGGNPWYTLMGVFENTTNGSFDHLNNINGDQAAYIFTFPGAGFFQDYDSTNGLTGVADHAFNVTLDAGKSYTVTAGLTSSSDEPLTNGASLELELYYGDGPNNMTVLASTNVVFTTNVFTNLTYFFDFQATIPEVKPSDPWAGKTVGIAFVSTTYDFSLVTGVWDVDNVRLTEKVATALNSPAATNGLFSFTLQSEPGLAFSILASTNVASPVASWTAVTTLTNVTGLSSFTDSTTNRQRFYQARLLP